MYVVQVHTGRGQPFVVHHLQNVEDVIENARLLGEGWKSLSDSTSARCDVSWIDFLNRVMRIAIAGDEFGAVMVFKSKNEKPLGFMVIFDDSEGKDRRSAFIYAGYSNGKYADAPVASMTYVQDWARQHGFTALRTQTRRINGAAMRLFRKKLGFRPLAMIFEKTL